MPPTSSTDFPAGLDTQLGRLFDGVELIAGGGRCADLCTIQTTAYALSGCRPGAISSPSGSPAGPTGRAHNSPATACTAATPELALIADRAAADVDRLAHTRIGEMVVDTDRLTVDETAVAVRRQIGQ